MAIRFTCLLTDNRCSAGAGYAYYQYKQGVNQSLKKMNNKASNVVYDFEGKKDQYGGTNILVLGSDARGKEKSRADTIMIVHYNEDKGTFKLTSIMRDSYLEIPGHGKHKVNALCEYKYEHFRHNSYG
ncbi:LCP family protein [Neobacillus drentensis]|uniref:LCP family protein n=1 Tax=Neobacillus drentensis TaxID=220684 RepID=UPI002FFE4EDC